MTTRKDIRQKSTEIAPSQQDAPSQRLGPRVDGAHAMQREPVSEPGAAQSPEELPSDRELLQLQASQLASHLRSEQRLLDEREAELNARTAKFESEVRSWRLVLDEKRQELEENEQELHGRTLEVERQAAAMSAAEIALEGDLAGEQAEATGRAAKLRDQEASVVERERELDYQERVLYEAQVQLAADREQLESVRADDRRTADGGDEQRMATREAELTRREQEHLQQVAACEEQSRALANKQAMLETAAAELDEQRVTLHSQAEQLANEEQATRRQADQRLADIAEEQRAAEREFALREEELNQLAARIDQRFATLEQVRAEVARMHQESLELRLAAEELWVGELAKQIPPERLAASLSAIRQNIAEHYEMEQEELERRRQEIVALVETLDARRSMLEQQRIKVQNWASRRQHEIEEQAARLIAREHELDRHERDLQREQQDRNECRLERDQELRTLFRDLGKQAA